MAHPTIPIVCEGGPYDGKIYAVDETLVEEDGIGLVFNMTGTQHIPRAVYIFTKDTAETPRGTALIARYKEPEIL